MIFTKAGEIVVFVQTAFPFNFFLQSEAPLYWRWRTLSLTLTLTLIDSLDMTWPTSERTNQPVPPINLLQSSSSSSIAQRIHVSSSYRARFQHFLCFPTYESLAQLTNDTNPLTDRE